MMLGGTFNNKTSHKQTNNHHGSTSEVQPHGTTMEVQLIKKETSNIIKRRSSD